MSWNMLNNGVCPPEPPSPLRFVKIDSGYAVNVAIDSLGRMYAWGGSYYSYQGQTPVATTGLNFTHHPATYRHSDNTANMVYAYQIGYPKSDWVDCQTWEYVHMALDTDGYIYAVGQESGYGQGGWNTTSQYRRVGGGSLEFTPGGSQAIVMTLVNDQQWSKFVLGGYHVLAQKTDKSLWVWGKNLDDATYGTLSYANNYVSFVPIQMTWVPGPVKFFDAGYSVTAIVTESNQIYAWGDWANIAIGFKQIPFLVPFSLPSGQTIVDMKCNYSGILILLSNGDAYGIGEYMGGTQPLEAMTFTKLLGGHTFTKIFAAHDTGAAALDSNGVIWAWGNQSYLIVQGGVDDIVTGTPTFTGGPVSTTYKWIDFAAGNTTHLAINDEGRLFCWGSDYEGMQGIGLFPSDPDSETRYAAIECGTYATLEDGTKPFAVSALIQQTISAPLAVGAPSGASSRWTMLYNGDCPHEAPEGLRYVNCASGLTNQVAVDNYGRLYTWGAVYWSYTGQTPVPVDGTPYYLPNPIASAGGDRTEVQRPTQVGTKSDWVRADVTFDKYMALDSLGYIYVWGVVESFYGTDEHPDLFDWNGTTNRYEPPGWEALIPTRHDSHTWESFSLGAYHALLQKADKSLWIWGENIDGTTFGTPAYLEGDFTDGPVELTWIPGPVKLYAADYAASVIVTESNEIWIWGTCLNLYYEPTQLTFNIPAGTSIVEVACDSSSGAVLIRLSNNDVYGWGNNIAFAPSLGTRESFLLNPGGQKFTQISCWDGGAFGLTLDGNAYGWGTGIYLLYRPTGPDNACTYRPNSDLPELTAANELGANNWSYICKGGWTHLAIDSEGRLWSWGENAYSELGVGLYETELDHACLPIQTLVPVDENGLEISVEGMLVG